MLVYTVKSEFENLQVKHLADDARDGRGAARAGLGLRLHAILDRDFEVLQAVGGGLGAQDALADALQVEQAQLLPERLGLRRPGITAGGGLRIVLLRGFRRATAAAHHNSRPQRAMLMMMLLMVVHRLTPMA